MRALRMNMCYSVVQIPKNGQIFHDSYRPFIHAHLQGYNYACRPLILKRLGHLRIFCVKIIYFGHFSRINRIKALRA